MPTKAKRSGQDRKRVSKQSHEIKHTGSKVAKKAKTTAKKGRKAVSRAKKQTGAVSRRKVERRAEALAK